MKTLLLLAALSLAFCKNSTGQILCILCYDQNDSISSGVNNLLLNGSFENGCGINGFFCPQSYYYSCNLTNWTCTGGSDTYANIYDGSSTVVAEGTKAAYFGNAFCQICSSIAEDLSCLNDVDCTVTGIPSGYPYNSVNYGGVNGISIKQTVTGLTIGSTYILEFWAGGENFGSFPNAGVFAVDVGFGDTLLHCKPTAPGAIGTTYIIEFKATSSTHTIKFTNWGHICSLCTELILDNVRLYTLAELSSTVPSCAGSSSPSFFAASDTNVCQKFCVNFFDSSTNNPTSWQWHFPGGVPSSSTDQNPANICYNSPGLFDVTLITTNANGSDTITLPDYITVYPTPPFPAIVQVGYTLTSSPASSYQWQLNSINIPGATNQSYTILQSGYYTILVADSNGCKNSATKYVLISSIDDLPGNAAISISPNPSSGNFTVELLNLEGEKNVSIIIVNTLGQIVFTSTDKIPAADWKTQIDLSPGVPLQGHDDGVFFLEIKSEKIFLKKKIIITNQE